MSTKPTHMRLSEKTLEQLDELCRHLGISTRSEAVRQAVHRWHLQVKPPKAASRRK